MKILFSPSEGKVKESDKNEMVDYKKMYISEISQLRADLVLIYKKELEANNIETLKKIFSTTKDKQAIELREEYKDLSVGITKAIKRYDGVAYEYLKYNELKKKEQDYIDKNTIIFSNLFGPLKGSDEIPNYKLKQDYKLSNINIPQKYNEKIKTYLDRDLQGEVIIDLRAGVYKKFYKTGLPTIEVKFLKQGKIVSHYSKAYRGKLLKVLAEDNSNTKDDFINSLKKIGDIVTTEINKNITEITIEIKEF